MRPLKSSGVSTAVRIYLFHKVPSSYSDLLPGLTCIHPPQKSPQSPLPGIWRETQSLPLDPAHSINYTPCGKCPMELTGPLTDFIGDGGTKWRLWLMPPVPALRTEAPSQSVSNCPLNDPCNGRVVVGCPCECRAKTLVLLFELIVIAPSTQLVDNVSPVILCVYSGWLVD